MSAQSGPDNLNSDINVTPLVDVMLVLLVIFMITAPMLDTGVSLELPKGDIPVEKTETSKLTLSISAERALFLGKTPVKWSELREKLESNARVQKEQTLYIEADAALPYRVVVAAMDLAQQAGVPKLLLKTSPTSETERAATIERLDRAAAAGGQPP